jgi:transposase-like protein
MNAANSKAPCPTPDCAAPHVVRNGTLKGRQRYHCKGCGAWFGETHGTPMYRLHTPPQEVGRALLVLMRRGSLRAAEEITGHKYETIGRWLRLAAEHAEALTEVLVHDLELSALEVDEFWSFVRRRSATSRLETRRDGVSAGAV